MLMQKFIMKDLGHFHYFLCIKVDRQRDKLLMIQHKYILDILHKTVMENSKPVSTPSILNYKMSAQDKTIFHDPTLYHSIVGMFQYLTFTRPNIIYTVDQVSRFMHAPTTLHKRILRYLKETIVDGLTYTPTNEIYSDHVLSTYTDADWAGDTDEKYIVT